MEVEIKVQKRDKAEFIWRSKSLKGSEAEKQFGRALGQWQGVEERGTSRKRRCARISGQDAVQNTVYTPSIWGPISHPGPCL
jgi:hypothetical protein